MVQLLRQHGTVMLRLTRSFGGRCLMLAGLLRVCAPWRRCEICLGYNLLAEIICLIAAKDVCGHIGSFLGQDMPVCVVHTAKKSYFCKFLSQNDAENRCIFHILV